MASSPCASGVPGSASPFQRSVGGATSAVGASGAWSITAPGHRHHVVVLRALQHVARGAVERRPLASGALSENVTQAQEDEDRQRQEDDGVNIHVAFAFWSAPATGPAVERFHQETAEITSCDWVCSM